MRWMVSGSEPGGLSVSITTAFKASLSAALSLLSLDLPKAFPNNSTAYQEDFVTMFMSFLVPAESPSLLMLLLLFVVSVSIGVGIIFSVGISGSRHRQAFRNSQQFVGVRIVNGHTNQIGVLSLIHPNGQSLHSAFQGIGRSGSHLFQKSHSELSVSSLWRLLLLLLLLLFLCAVSVIQSCVSVRQNLWHDRYGQPYRKGQKHRDTKCRQYRFRPNRIVQKPSNSETQRRFGHSLRRCFRSGWCSGWCGYGHGSIFVALWYMVHGQSIVVE
mmetsp:Transcript_24931/g.52927  ORF Transcript_24931/g.52927 Transcript_24931/m.52927 type:complete len:271 (+) Transcript_24931:602-1414(+)